MTLLRHTTIDSPIGPLLLVADDQDRLRGLYTNGHARRPMPPPGTADVSGVLARAASQLGEYFAGERTAFELRTHAEGTPLQKRVWEALVRVPYGTTTSYGRLALVLGLPVGAARAVGAANARNPISIVVPCHRVIAATGALTGYAGGLEAKQTLLDLEACPAALSRSTATRRAV